MANDQQKQRQTAALDTVIGLFPSKAALARLLALRSSEVIRQWRRTQVPIKYCVPLEKLTRGQVKRDQLREDWYEQVMGRRRA